MSRRRYSLSMQPSPVETPLGVTMDLVARTAGVSRATVSRVLSGSEIVAATTRDKVLKVVAQLGYVPNTAAKQLASSRSDVVGLLLRDPRNPAYGLLHSELQNQTEMAGLQLVAVIPSKEAGPASESAGLRRLLGLRVGGLFVASGVIDAKLLVPFLPVVPLVSVGRPEYHKDIYSVAYDELENGRLLADAVLEKGHRRVAVAAVAKHVSFGENLRSTSMIARLRERGATVIAVDETVFGDATQSNGTIIELVRSHQVSAALFPSDRRMLRFAEVASAAGIRIPDDVSVVGCDGVFPGVGHMGLATLRIPVETVARRAVEVMSQMLRAPGETPPRHELHPGVFLPGRSLSAPPSCMS